MGKQSKEGINGQSTQWSAQNESRKRENQINEIAIDKIWTPENSISLIKDCLGTH